MHDLERRMMLAVDNISRLALFKKLRQENGFDEKASAERVRKSFPIFGDPDDTIHTTGDDRPLPYELKNRVNIYVERRSLTDQVKFKREIEESSTVNVLIRKEIKNGNL